MNKTNKILAYLTCILVGVYWKVEHVGRWLCKPGALDGASMTEVLKRVLPQSMIGRAT